MRLRAAAIAAPLAVALAGCNGPLLVFPGGALGGEVVDPPPTDWSFATDRFIELETRPGDPYSVELNYFVKDGKLYVDPAEGRRWLDHIRADPRVRVRLGGKVYPLKATLVDDPVELEGFDPERFVLRLDPR